MGLPQYESKSVTPVDEYECTLTDELKAMAQREFGETEEIRIEAIRTMRDWIMSNARIEKCRMDSKFILRFLRFRKYNIPAAQEAFERYLVFREGIYGLDWLSNMDFAKPNIDKLIDNGMLIVFPKRDKFGRVVVMTRLSAADPSISSIGTEALTTMTLIIETLLEEEEHQIRGFSYIFDVSNITLRHYMIFSFPTWFKMAKNVEKIFAARHKGFHVVNIHATLKFISKLVLHHMPEKLKNRVYFYTSFDEVDVLPRSELPIECGGTIEIKNLTDPWKETLKAKRDFFLKHNDMKVNRAFYPKSVLNCDVHTLNKTLESTCSLRKEKKTFSRKVIEID